MLEMSRESVRNVKGRLDIFVGIDLNESMPMASSRPLLFDIQNKRNWHSHIVSEIRNLL